VPEYDHARPPEPLVPVADQLSFQSLLPYSLVPDVLSDQPLELPDPVPYEDESVVTPLVDDSSAKPESLPLCVPPVAAQLPPAPSVQ
jgi:hypothetical protein